jgi:hypothetical protein
MQAYMDKLRHVEAKVTSYTTPVMIATSTALENLKSIHFTPHIRHNHSIATSADLVCATSIHANTRNMKPKTCMKQSQPGIVPPRAL